MPNPFPPPAEPFLQRAPRLCWLSLLAGVLLAGCASPSPTPPPAEVAEWQTQTGQAVWQARRHTPPLAGELVLVRRANGDFLLQFSKSPLTLVEATRVGKRWRVAFPGQSRQFRGSGAGTPRLLWLWLPVALEGGALPADVTFTRQADHWRLVHARTGETLEGYLNP